MTTAAVTTLVTHDKYLNPHHPTRSSDQVERQRLARQIMGARADCLAHRTAVGKLVRLRYITGSHTSLRHRFTALIFGAKPPKRTVVLGEALGYVWKDPSQTTTVGIDTDGRLYVVQSIRTNLVPVVDLFVPIDNPYDCAMNNQHLRQHILAAILAR